MNKIFIGLGLAVATVFLLSTLIDVKTMIFPDFSAKSSLIEPATIEKPPAEKPQSRCQSDKQLLEISERRKLQIREHCKKYREAGKFKGFVSWKTFQETRSQFRPIGPDVSPKIWWNDFRISDKFKAIFCAVEKTGSTFAISYFKQLANVSEASVKKPNNHANKSIYFFEAIRETNEAKRKFDEYFKFFIIREPLERLISAWHENVSILKSPSKLALNAGRISAIIKVLSHFGHQVKDSTGGIRRNLTLTEFFSFLGIWNDSSTLNVHYRPQSYLSYPCEIEYDFIGLMDNYACDYEYIGRRISGKNKVPEIAVRQSSKSQKLKFLESVPVDLVEKVLLKHYSIDYELLGFKMPKFKK